MKNITKHNNNHYQKIKQFFTREMQNLSFKPNEKNFCCKNFTKNIFKSYIRPYRNNKM